MLARISLVPREIRNTLRELVHGNATLRCGGILPLGYDHDGDGHAAISVERLQAPRAVEILRAAGFEVAAIRQAWIPRTRHRRVRVPLRVAWARPPRLAPRA